MNTTSSQRYRIGIADSRNSHLYFRDVCKTLDADLFDDVTAQRIEDGLDVDLCIVTGEYWPEQIALLTAARARHIATLHVMDGILEWRNTWEHPQLISPLLQPVLADKLACLGRSQRRVLESWGNYGKCEVVGAPRLDALPDRQTGRQPGSGFTFLVASARTPWFDDGQKQRVVQAYRDLGQALSRLSGMNGHAVRVIWRLQDQLSRELSDDLPVDNRVDVPLADQLGQADAIITSPSSLMLEGMLYGKPVAVLDYTNSPQYVQSAWTVTAPDHIQPVLRALQQPEPSRLLLQDYFLHDALECREPAGPRLARLMLEMLRIRTEAVAGGRTPVYPDAILDTTRDPHHHKEDRYDPAVLYPQHRIYSEQDTGVLQAEILHCRHRITQLEQELHQSRTAQQRSVIARLLDAVPGSAALRRLVRSCKRTS